MATALALASTSAGCDRNNQPLCVERLCFELTMNTPVRSSAQKHSIRPENSAGWIDIQRFTSATPPEGTPTELSDLLARRHALVSSIRVLSHGTATLTGMHQEVATNDLALQWQGRAYRRRTWLLPGDQSRPWTLIDVTGPANDWTSVEQSLVTKVQSMRPL